jgi:hypothetical protein
MPQAQRLADHAADGQPDEVARSMPRVHHRDDVVGEPVDGVGRGRGAAAAVAAQVDAQRPVSGCGERGHLFGPHAEVGGERMGKRDDLARFRTDEVVADVAPGKRE